MTQPAFQRIKTFRMELEWADGQKAVITGESVRGHIALDEDLDAELQPDLFPDEPLLIATPRRKEVVIKLRLDASSRVVVSDATTA